MIIYTDQLDRLREIIQKLAVKRAEPLVIRGENIDFVWPPSAPQLPLDLLDIMPPNTYVILKGDTITVIP